MLCVPAIIVCLGLIRLSRQPRTIGVVSLLGVAFGALFSPGWILTERDGWQTFVVDYLFSAIPPAFGALLLGGALLADELVARRKVR
jgi:hypothetical protein